VNEWELPTYDASLEDEFPRRITTRSKFPAPASFQSKENFMKSATTADVFAAQSTNYGDMGNAPPTYDSYERRGKATCKEIQSPSMGPSRTPSRTPTTATTATGPSRLPSSFPSSAPSVMQLESSATFGFADANIRDHYDTLCKNWRSYHDRDIYQDFSMSFTLFICDKIALFSF